MDGSLPQLRTDWLLGRWVIVAENRALRPNEFGGELTDAPGAPPTTGAHRAATCAFCLGQEHRTPPALFELTDEHGQWRTRVVPNRFPAVVQATGDCPLFSSAGEIERESEVREKGTVPSNAAPSQRAAPALGVHEVIIESPRHVDRLSLVAPHELRDVLETYVERLRTWRDSGQFAYGIIFKNQGARAGASLAHLHSQLIALPSVPPAVAAESERAARSFREQRQCPYCRLIDQERAASERIVLDVDGFVAFCPIASLQPFEVWVLPEEHAPFFEDLSTDRLDRLANVLWDLARRVEVVARDSAYNLLLRTSPWQGGAQEWHHWRIEILPRASAFAGFELASGMFINSLAPERAASKLRSI